MNKLLSILIILLFASTASAQSGKKITVKVGGSGGGGTAPFDSAYVRKVADSLKNTNDIAYYIKTDATGNFAVATGFRGNPMFIGTPATVLQSAIDVVTPQNSLPHIGGSIIMLGGLQNTWGEEINIRGWTGDQLAGGILSIVGDGTAVFTQNAPGYGIFNVTNGAMVRFKDLRLGIGSATGKSAINFYSDSVGTRDHEASCYLGIIDNVKIGSSSTTHAGFYAENFFGMYTTLLSVKGEQYTSIKLVNRSETTNYGNSQFNQTEALAPNNDAYAGLELSSDNGHPMNLNTFNVVNIGTTFFGPGQPNGTGLRLKNSSHNLFTHTDIEYMPKSISLEGGSRDNTFLSGYLHPDGNTKAVGIASSAGANSNNFIGLIEVDGTNAYPVADSGTTTPSRYDLVLSGSVDETKLYTANPNTPVTYRRNGYTYYRTRLSELQINHASKGVGKVLTSDADGNATWQSPVGGETFYPVGGANIAIDSTDRAHPVISAIISGSTDTATTVYLKDFTNQVWKLTIDSSGQLITQKYPAIIIENSEYLNYEGLYFSGPTVDAVTGSIHSTSSSTSFESLRKFAGNGSVTFKFDIASPTTPAVNAQFGLTMGSDYFVIKYHHTGGVPTFQFPNNQTTETDITGATVNLSNFYRVVRTGTTVAVFTDASETGTFSTLVKTWSGSAAGSEAYASGFIGTIGDGFTLGKYRTINLISNK